MTQGNHNTVEKPRPIVSEFKLGLLKSKMLKKLQQLSQADKVVAFGVENRRFETSHPWSTSPLRIHLLSAIPSQEMMYTVVSINNRR